jgi:hypothetical protein
MGNKHKDEKRQGLVIEYRELGTISIDELAHAVFEDIQALKEIYNVHYVKGARLRLPITNEYGENLTVTRPSGGRIFRMDTHHFRPACKDYDL